ncbi:MAG TPA: hypothetical protein VH188_00730 [Chthoniobacterales bacterium]|jgi:hypothetical protein|nr:hypothetical protein [Chthoniobacterales bacterium]
MKRLTLVLLLFSVIGARADLKTWLHGTPPAPSPGPPDAKAAAVSFAANVTPDKQILDFMNAFVEAMRIHDGKSLKPFLSERYAIEDLPEDHDPADFFMQAMVIVKAPDEIVITGIASERETRIAKMEFRSAERGTKVRTFKFDAKGKLLSADFFTLKRQ